MGTIGKCCCEPGDCCLCDDAWDLETWSVTVLGKTFSGSWTPADKPVPFDQENGCHLRLGSQCHVEEEEVAWNCIGETAWSDASVYPGQKNPISSDCGVNCGQCICRDLYGGYADGCEVPRQTVWEYSQKSWTHYRGWTQESHYGEMQVQCGTVEDPNDSSVVVFRFFLYYQVARFFNASSGTNNRFRQVDFDCIYEDGNQSTAASNIVYGSWVYPPHATLPPCSPCSWLQTTFFGNCSTVNADCPTNPGDVELISDTYTFEFAVMPCDFWDYYDFDNDGKCEESENDAPKLYVAESTVSFWSTTSNTEYCETANLGAFPFSCSFDTETSYLEMLFESEPITCDSIPCSVTLTRITGPGPIDPSLSVEVLPEIDCEALDCDPVPAVTKTLPGTITLTLTGTCT